MAATLPPRAHHLTRKRNGIYYWRRRVPRAGRRAEVALSLRTRRYREAEHLAAVVDAAFEEALSAMATPAISPNLVQAAALLCKGNTAAQVAVELEEAAEATEARYREMAPFWALRRAISGADFARRAVDAERALAFLAEAPPAKGPAHRAAGTVVQEPAPDAVPAPSAAPPEATAMPAPITVEAEAMATAGSDGATGEASPGEAGPKPASSFVKKYFEHREKVQKRAHHPMLQDRGTIRMFFQVCGDRPFRRYKRKDMTDFLEVMRRLPPIYGKSKRDKARTLVEIADEADRNGVGQRLDEGTVERHFRALAQFFHYGFDKNQITKAQKDAIFTERRFYPQTGARQQRGVMTPEERAALFASPEWADPGCIRNALFWTPLMIQYHGTRLEEVADLARSDVACEGGIWFLRISVERRRLKNDNAVRRVPLHPELLAMGFVEYAAHVAPNPGDPVFPDLKRRKGDGKRGDYIVDRLAVIRRQQGVYRKGVSLQSMRHDVNTRLRDGTMGKDVGALRCIRHIIGHAGGKVEEEGNGEGERRYDQGPPLADMLAVLSRVSYPELDFSHLHGWRPDPGKAVARKLTARRRVPRAQSSRPTKSGAVEDEATPKRTE